MAVAPGEPTGSTRPATDSAAARKLPWRPVRPAPGEHTWEVLSGLLGYDDDRIADLAAAGLLE